MWDAGKVLVTTQYNATTPTDWQSNTQRRVFYPGLWQADGSYSQAGTWVKGAQLLQPSVKNSTDGNVQYDLWAGFGLSPGLAPGASPDSNANDPLNDSVRTSANTAISGPATAAVPNPILLMKTALVQGETTPRQFLLGDIFHSDPVVIGSPSNLIYYTKNVGSDQNGASPVCNAGMTALLSNADHGYRCFFTRHQYRRKVLTVGHNDGMLHAFDAGIFEQNRPNPTTGTPGVFSDGNGNELFGFMPRTVMPTAYRTTGAGATHAFSVDGSPIAGDVFIDPIFASGTPNPAEREWRTVLMGGLREGGSGYYALDITQPDTLQDVTLNGSAAVIPNPSLHDTSASGPPYLGNSTLNWVPECINSFGGNNTTKCGPIPYAAPLWEFTDNSSDQIPASGGATPFRLPMDEDGNGYPDLGATWSNPTIGRIHICTGGNCSKNIEDRYVAIFGGGLDAGNKPDPRAGLYLYMVDIETGHVLYKRKMPDLDVNHTAGAIPAGAAAVDTDQDGYFDRIYVATTGGFLYRIDLGADANGNYPALTRHTVTALSGVGLTSFDVLRIDDNFWQPQMIFDGTLDATTGQRLSRPIYYRPSVFFIAKLGTYGVAFGSGDREDLWTTDGQNGRFWVFVDDSPSSGVTLPYTESNFTRIDVANTTQLTTDQFLTNSAGHRGWYFVLGPNERLITPGFSLFGVMFFTSYAPLSYATTDPSCDPLNPPAGGCPQIVLSCSDKKQNTTGYCAKTGTSRLFVVNATNGNGLLPNVSGGLDRYNAISQFVTQPFTEPGTNKNSPQAGNGNNADTLTADDIKVMNIIKGLFPKECKFANYRVDVKTIESDTTVKRIAAVPMCVIQKAWKEF
jgi:Tfp pilus tip-associated adhesin PilY1